MVSSSRRAFLGEVVPRVICIAILVLLNQAVMAMSSIVALQDKELVSEGGTAKIPFQLCGKEKPSCTLEQSLNLSAPSPECTLDHRHERCEMTVAPQNDPLRSDLHRACEICVLVVHGVTQVDVGQYSMCQPFNRCASRSGFWRNISILEIVNEPTLSSTPGHVSTDRTENTTPGIVALQDKERVSEGGTAKIPFELCGKEKLSCTLEQSLNLSAPSPECTLDHRHGRCEMTVAPQNDPFCLDLPRTCEVCVLVVHGVTQVDAGQYSMCQTSNICASTSDFWRNISILEIVSEPLTPSSTPRHVSTDRTENTTPDAPKITKPTTEKSPEKNSVVGTDKTTENDSQTGMKLSSAVGIPVTLIILLALAIVAVVYICKRNTRRRGHEQYQPPSNSLLNGNTTTGCQSTMIEIDSENTPVHEGPDSNMQ